MEVIIRKGLNKTFNNWIKHATEFFAGNLFTKKELYKIKFEIEFQTSPKYKDFGECYWDDDSTTATIVINRNNSPETIIRTLAHELAHAQQFFNYELIALRDDRWMWNGEIIRISNNAKTYNDSPWEIAARSAEVELTSKWFSKNLE